MEKVSTFNCLIGENNHTTYIYTLGIAYDEVGR